MQLWNLYKHGVEGNCNFKIGSVRLLQLLNKGNEKNITQVKFQIWVLWMNLSHLMNDVSDPTSLREAVQAMPPFSIVA